MPNYFLFYNNMFGKFAIDFVQLLLVIEKELMINCKGKVFCGQEPPSGESTTT